MTREVNVIAPRYPIPTVFIRCKSKISDLIIFSTPEDLSQICLDLPNQLESILCSVYPCAPTTYNLIYPNCPFQISGDCKTLPLIKTFKLSGAVTDLAYSPNGAYLATADANRKVTLLDQDYEKANSREWGFHTAKVN